LLVVYSLKPWGEAWNKAIKRRFWRKDKLWGRYNLLQARIKTKAGRIIVILHLLEKRRLALCGKNLKNLP